VSFELDTCTLTSTAGRGGSISTLGATVVSYGDRLAFTMTPDVGYHVLDVLVDGASVGPVSSYTYPNITADHTIDVSFELDTFTVTSTAGLGGSISPLGATIVSYGDSLAFTMAPDVGYHVLDVLVNGASVGAVSSYTFANITSDQTIDVSFELDTFTVTSTAGLGGSINPLGATVVSYGDSLAFTMTPDVGYQVLDVLVNGVSVGAVTSYTFTNIMSDHTIDVSFELETFTVTSTAGLGGSISPLGATVVSYGDSLAFTMTPDVAYHVLDVLVDGASVGAVSSYTFANITSDHTIDVSFELDTFTVTSTAGLGGSISPLGATVVSYGDSLAFTMTPDVGYHVLDVLVNGASVGVVTSYTFPSITSDHTIDVSFELDTFTVTSTAGVGGSINPLGATVVSYGDNLSFTMTPDVGYHILDVLVDGASVGPVGSYTFANITSDHTIDVSFELDMFTVTSSAGLGGSISPLGATVVSYGDSLAFTMTPDVGYHVLDVLVDGASVGAVSSYTFPNITSDHTIDVSFELDTFTVTSTAGLGGSISPFGATVVSYGDSLAFTMTPDVGYYVLDVLVDGASVGPVSSYTFTNITADHTIDVSFELDTFTVTSTAGLGGSISPLGATVVSYGDSLAFTMTPDVGYQVLDVLVDGASVGAVILHVHEHHGRSHDRRELRARHVHGDVDCGPGRKHQSPRRHGRVLRRQPGVHDDAGRRLPRVGCFCGRRVRWGPELVHLCEYHERSHDRRELRARHVHGDLDSRFRRSHQSVGRDDRLVRRQPGVHDDAGCGLPAVGCPGRWCLYRSCQHLHLREHHERSHH
jgi:hypothetical protein